MVDFQQFRALEKNSHLLGRVENSDHRTKQYVRSLKAAQQGNRQRGREVWSLKKQYLSEEVMIPCGGLLLLFVAVFAGMVLEQAECHTSDPCSIVGQRAFADSAGVLME